MPLQSKAQGKRQGNWWSEKRLAASRRLSESRRGPDNPYWKGGVDRRSYSRTYYQANKEKHRAYKWKQRGIKMTHAEYFAMLNKQDGKCAICKESCQRGKLSVDHDHKTGQIRGLLCRTCNVILGILENNVSRIQNMKEYLDACR